MKCGKCGKRANTIKAMGAHYRKKHAASMKRRTPRSPTRREPRSVSTPHVSSSDSGERKGGVYHPVGCRCEGCK